MTPTPRVVLANISREHITQATHVSIIGALQTGRITNHLVVASGPYLDAGRNKAVAAAMTLRDPDDPAALTWDWFLFVDSDIEFTTAQFDDLLAPTTHPDYSARDYPVIGGVYVNPFDDGEVDGEDADPLHSGQIGPVCYEWRERDDLPGQLRGVPTPTFIRLSRLALATLPPVNEPWNPPGTDTTPSPICQVAAIGTGFLAIHHTLLTAMGERYGEPLPWFDEPVHQRVHYGEDMGFAIRCAEMGYPVLAHRGVTPLHHKTLKLI